MKYILMTVMMLAACGTDEQMIADLGGAAGSVGVKSEAVVQSSEAILNGCDMYAGASIMYTITNLYNCGTNSWQTLPSGKINPDCYVAGKKRTIGFTDQKPLDFNRCKYTVKRDNKPAVSSLCDWLSATCPNGNVGMCVLTGLPNTCGF